MRAPTLVGTCGATIIRVPHVGAHGGGRRRAVEWPPPHTHTHTLHINAPLRQIETCVRAPHSGGNFRKAVKATFNIDDVHTSRELLQNVVGVGAKIRCW